MISVSSDTDDEWWYIQDVRTGAIDGFYRQKKMAESSMRYCVRTYKRWMVLKKAAENETHLDFEFWLDGNVDWFEDYLYNRGVYADS